MDIKGKKILVTGGSGFLGKFLIERLAKEGANLNDISIPRSKDVDFRNFEQCKDAIKGNDIVIHLAGRVGGIVFNMAHSGDIFYDNISMGVNVIEASRQLGIQKVIAISSVCAYPKFAPIPFKEKDLWEGYPEETNAPYGLAKKMLIVQTKAYHDQYGSDMVCLVPVNLYGPGDNFDPQTGHVIPALIRKIYDAKVSGKAEIDIWGSGKATREFLYVQDAAEAIVLATKNYDKPDPVNLGSGMEISIKDLVGLISEKIGYSGKINWDVSKPDGQPRRCLDVSLAQKEFGFKASTSFKEGLGETINWYIQNKDSIK